MVLNYTQISRNYYKIKPVPNKVDRAISQFQISYVTQFLTTTNYEKIFTNETDCYKYLSPQ